MQAQTEAISVVIPVFNAQHTLAATVATLTEVLPSLAQEYEIILVNDGSTDNSWASIEKLARENARIVGISLTRNFGQHSATLVGIRSARYPITATMDVDGQHNTRELQKMLDVLMQGNDLVYGYAERLQHSPLRNVMTRTAKYALEVSGWLPSIKKITTFRVFHTRLRESFRNFNAPFVSIDTLLRWGTDRIGFTPIQHHKRQGGKSSYTLLRLISLVMDAVTSYSIACVRSVELLGIALIAGGTCLGLLSVFGQEWGLLIATIVFCSGIITLSVGLVGEYAARHYLTALGKPMALIQIQTSRNSS